MTRPTGPTSRPVNAGQIDLWSVDLRQPEAGVSQLATTLSTGEAARAARFRFPRDRRRYIVATASLRAILAQHLRLEPTRIQFEQGRWGKPRVTGPADCPPSLHFNLSRSGDLALIAVSCTDEIGVDVERLDPRHADLRVAEQCFHPAETAALLELKGQDRTVGFFRCWTRKEAFVKLLGQGLSVDLSSFCVSVGADEPASLLECDTSLGRAREYCLYEVDRFHDYIGCIATRRPARSVMFRSWQPDASA